MAELTLQEGVAVGGGLGVSAGHEGGGGNERLGEHFVKVVQEMQD